LTGIKNVSLSLLLGRRHPNIKSELIIMVLDIDPCLNSAVFGFFRI